MYPSYNYYTKYEQVILKTHMDGAYLRLYGHSDS